MQAPFTTGSRGQAASVLLVDDDADMRRMYGRRLRADGHKVVDGADGPQAISAAAGGPA